MISNLHFRVFFVVFVSIRLHRHPYVYGATNATATKTPKPDVADVVVPAIPVPRLPSSYEVVEANVNDTLPGAETAAKIYTAVAVAATATAAAAAAANRGQNVTKFGGQPFVANATDREQRPQNETAVVVAAVRGTPPPLSHYQPSSSTTSPSYVVIGETGKGKKADANFVGLTNLQTGFRPFVPSRPAVAYVAAATTTPIRPYPLDERDASLDARFKSSPAIDYERFYGADAEFGRQPTYGQIQSADYYDGSKYGGSVGGGGGGDDGKLSFATTYDVTLPTVYPTRRPLVATNSAYKPRKKYPVKSVVFGRHHHPQQQQQQQQLAWKLPAGQNGYDGGAYVQHDIDGFADDGHYGQLDDVYGLLAKPTFTDKPTYKKNGLLRILTTLIPIGLLLSALPPRVIFINSTNPTNPSHKPFFRHIETELSQINTHNDTLFNLVTNIGLQPSSDTECNKWKICEAALNGTKETHSFVENSLWHLLSRSSDTIRANLNLQDVYEAVKQDKCSKFSCSKVEIWISDSNTIRNDNSSNTVDVDDNNVNLHTHLPYNVAR